MMLNGLRIIVNPLLTETVQYSRSPGRAKRRMRRGYRQHFITRPQQAAYRMGDTLVMHPATFDVLRRQLTRQP